jgi:hypothetical protein
MVLVCPFCLSLTFIHLNRLIGFHKSRYDCYNFVIRHPDALSFNVLHLVKQHGRHENV